MRPPSPAQALLVAMIATLLAAPAGGAGGPSPAAREIVLSADSLDTTQAGPPFAGAPQPASPSRLASPIVWIASFALVIVYALYRVNAERDRLRHGRARRRRRIFDRGEDDRERSGNRERGRRRRA